MSSEIPKRHRFKSTARFQPTARFKSTTRFKSTALSISWSFWWRRLVSIIAFDALVICLIALGFIHSYNEQVAPQNFSYWFFPTSEISAVGLYPTVSQDYADLTYRIELESGDVYTYDLSGDLMRFAPLYAIGGTIQAVGLLRILSDTRRVRRKLGRLNELAIAADSLGVANPLENDKIETLEQAIERVRMDSPQVSTGDHDLTSIEIALNRLLTQMHEARLQQMRFVNDVSHELRTPIAVIQGYTDILARWGTTDEQVLSESIEALRSESTRMQTLVEQLLFLARGDAGRNEPHKVAVNMFDLVQEVCTESQMIDDKHHYSFEYEAVPAGHENDNNTEHKPWVEADPDDADCKAWVEADPGMLRQALRSLVQNAAKYSPEHRLIRLVLKVENGQVHTSVIDEGIGMDQEAAGHAFDRFYRADNARETGVQGSGLGLSIVKWIVEVHHGQLDIISREGVGTRVTLTLPHKPATTLPPKNSSCFSSPMLESNLPSNKTGAKLPAAELTDQQ